MESIRSHYTKMIQTEIREMERFKIQAEKRNNLENVHRYEHKINQLKQELSYDSPRFHDFHIQQTEILEHQKQTQAKSQVRNEDQKKKSDQFYDLEILERKKQRNLQYQMKKQWEWLCTQEANLPEYIKNNLDRMPNNKGYIWKGIWYFGHQPEEDSGILIMFEKQGNGDMLVHEIKHNSYYRIFSRSKNGQNTLISEKQMKERF